MTGPIPTPYGGTVPVLRLGHVLLVTFQGDLHDSQAEQLQQDISEAAADNRISGVVLDLSGVEIVDSFLGRVIGDIAAKTRLLAAETVVAGMRPAVAITLVELGLTLPGLRTALSTEQAMHLLDHASVSPRPGRTRQESP